MKLMETPVESLFSDNKYGNMIIYVSVHNSTMGRSIGLKHVKNVYKIMRDKVEMATLSLIAGGKRPTTYFVLVACYGKPEHNLGHLLNQIYLFSLSLAVNNGKLVATCSCTGLSYLNTSEQAMAILNIGLSGLALSKDPNTEEWLTSKVLKG